jgi:hypothetical protein
MDLSPARMPRALPLWSWAPAFLAALVVAIVLFGTSPTARAPSPSEGTWSVGDHWTNGIVNAEFEPHAPGVTVASVWGEPGYGLYAGLGGLGEYNSSGTLVEAADFSHANWAVANDSTRGELALDYSARLPVTRGSAGFAEVEVNFTSGAAGGPPGSTTNGVEFTVAVQGWPWQSARDSLGMDFPLWPNNDSLEHISTQVSNRTLNCLANDSDTAEEYFGWAAQAEARGANATQAALTPQATLQGSPQYLDVVVILSGGLGGYSSLTYDPLVGILGHPAVGSVPTTELGISLTVAGGGVALAALVLGRSRRRTSPLEMVEEDA